MSKEGVRHTVVKMSMRRDGFEVKGSIVINPKEAGGESHYALFEWLKVCMDKGRQWPSLPHPAKRARYAKKEVEGGSEGRRAREEEEEEDEEDEEEDGEGEEEEDEGDEEGGEDEEGSE